MRYSRAFIPTLKEVPKDATNPSHVLLLRAGYMRMVGAGIYELLPLGLRVLHKISNIVRQAMDKAGAQEILMPAFIPSDYFKESGRWDDFGQTLLRLKDRHESDYLLAPTHEEVITDLARRELRSYKQLPQTLYQIQMKYRDEPRPRAGLLRCREFLMKDAYSFDKDESSALKSYEAMKEAYHGIFTRMGLDYRVVAADSGAMGGSTSAEFQILASTGEDSILACNDCEYAANTEVTDAQGVTDSHPCPQCGKPNTLGNYRGIEAGHIFVLGTHYSQKMNATFLDVEGKATPLVMGCYGIGISRLIAGAIEQHHDDQGMKWPLSIAPYQVLITQLGNDEKLSSAAYTLYQSLWDQGIECLWDDREERAGAKFKDADLIGIPWRITLGARGLAENTIEVQKRGEDPQKIGLGSCVQHLVSRIKG